jgi:hypothetical protein
MKNLHYILILTLTLMCSSCAPLAYLPTIDKIGESQYGAHIHIRSTEKKSFDGELIAVTNDCVYVLCTNEGRRLDSIARNRIIDFRLQFAQTKAGLYSAFIPLSAVVTLAHGWWLLISMPVNVITTSIIAIDSNESNTINKKSILWSDLSMYARFPQGIPENIRKEDIQ